MVRYYCSGFDTENAFGHGIGEMLKKELRETKSIVFIPGNPEKVEKAKTKYLPAFVEHFKRVGIVFDNVYFISPEMSTKEAERLIKNADFVMLMGGEPYKMKGMCEKLQIMQVLKDYNGVMMGYSAGAMLMSKNIVITPCCEEYPEFHIEGGLGLDEISIYPHTNTQCDVFPDPLEVGGFVCHKKDFVIAAKQVGKLYLIQDIGKDISYVKSVDGRIELRTENNGKIWEVNNDIQLLTTCNKEMSIK